MNKKEAYLLRNYQSLMQPHERLAARWLTEDWNGVDQDIPGWLRNRVWSNFSMQDLGKPNAMARDICLRLLKDHKTDLILPSGKDSY